MVFVLYFYCICFLNLHIVVPWWYRISTVFVIYVWKYKWCSGKPKAVRVRLNNNDSVAKQPKRRITLDTAQQYHRFGKLIGDTFGDTTGQNQWNLHQTLVLYFVKTICNWWECVAAEDKRAVAGGVQCSAISCNTAISGCVYSRAISVQYPSAMLGSLSS